jgi:hypothetical protein
VALHRSPVLFLCSRGHLDLGSVDHFEASQDGFGLAVFDERERRRLLVKADEKTRGRLDEYEKERVQNQVRMQRPSSSCVNSRENRREVVFRLLRHVGKVLYESMRKLVIMSAFETSHLWNRSSRRQRRR